MLLQPRRAQALVLFVALLVQLLPFTTNGSNIACTESKQCETILRNGSQCVDGLCSNPFYHGGCLQRLLPNWNRTRVCNSEDPPEAEALGYCRSSPMQYKEIRIAALNWESAIFVTWIFQILLSELLDVPTSVDPGTPGVNMNLYDPASGFDLDGVVMDYHYKGFGVADRVKDCQLVKTNDPNTYEACFHMVPEMWWSTFLEEGKIEGIEPLRELGAMGENSWFIPKFTAERDPTLISWLGLRGEQNRRKVAETFKRPTRWSDYCEEISMFPNCSHSDWYAQRAPANDEEGQSFFVEGLYNGYFRMTDAGDCSKFPDSCTGFFLDYPCGWNTFAQQQCFHLDMPFSFEGPEPNGGFPPSEAAQIWMAANATKSAVAMVWWSPQPLYEAYLGTDAEFTKVNLPPPTPECADSRMDLAELCVENATVKPALGEPEGSCDFYPQLLQKVFSLALKEITQDDTIAEAFWSPGLDLANDLRLDNLQLSEIFKLWLDRGTDTWGFDPRDATCEWVAANLESLQDFVPKTYPRVVKEVDSERETLFGFAFGFAIFAIVMVVSTVVVCVVMRKTMAVYHMQTHFLSLVFFGMLLVAIGALISTVTPSDASCAVTPYLINLGYVFHFMPLLLRMSAISRLVTDGKLMQRARLRPKDVYAYVGVVVALILVFLILWTALDSPEKTYEYELTDHLTAEGQNVIESYDYCGAEDDIYWLNVSFVWRGLLLLAGCMIGFLALRVRKDVNDTKSLFCTLVVHLLILVLQIIACSVLFDSRRSDFMGYASILYSFDTIATIGLYILPKFFDSEERSKTETEILPDLFVHTTIARMEIVGFTAWASVREPVAVFQFLEQLYGNFDRVAARHSVFKVEVVGECYIAATGVPKPQTEHALLMARFAWDCIEKMPKYVKQMETRFGPDTREMSLKIAMNSGPVTGGYLKGKGSRFQLFGATTAKANQLLSSSLSGRILLSEATARLLIKNGKKHWVVKREEKVDSSQTYWLENESSRRGSSRAFGSKSFALDGIDASDADISIDVESGWVEWNVGVFQDLLKQIVARREETLLIATPSSLPGPSDVKKAGMPIEEVKEIIELPTFDKRAARRQMDNKENATIPELVVDELRSYISEIAALYNDFPFHNFAHASYVVMATTKYMNRIIAATEADLGDNEERGRSDVQSALHDHTYGITSDPLTQFACVFSALIHDVQHPGVPNNKWIEENEEVAKRYKERSVAEQNSLDVSWDLLMQSRFDKLRSTICSNAEELQHFRQLIVNCVMATDLGDKELKLLRNGRWDKAFAQEGTSRTNDSEISETNESTSGSITEVERQRKNLKSEIASRKQLAKNRKATIVIEHLIQAADIAHTCQHWNIFRKWNERLFRELYQAYREGRSEMNPADNWYTSEIGFFDFYIIPLAQKIRDCGVFGPTSDENLNYANINRSRWIDEGEQIVKDMLEQAAKDYDAKNTPNEECALDPVVRLTPLAAGVQQELEMSA